VAKLRGLGDKYGHTVFPDRDIQLHDLSIGVSVGENQTNDDAAPVEKATVDTAKLAAHVANKGHRNASGRIYSVLVSESTVVCIPSVDGVGRCKLRLIRVVNR